MMDERARVHLTDVLAGGLATIAMLALAPAMYDMTDTIAVDAGPLGQLLLQLVVPFLFLAVIISVGVSARRKA